jgi:hypothetical protein
MTILPRRRPSGRRGACTIALTRTHAAARAGWQDWPEMARAAAALRIPFSLAQVAELAADGHVLAEVVEHLGPEGGTDSALGDS